MAVNNRGHDPGQTQIIWMQTVVLALYALLPTLFTLFTIHDFWHFILKFPGSALNKFISYIHFQSLQKC